MLKRPDVPDFLDGIEHLKEWEAQAPRAGRMLTLEETAAAGRRLWGRDAMKPSWKERSWPIDE